MEPELDRQFHVDSYGYRPGKSALDAVGQARERCWRYDWVLDLDIKGFFDNIDQKSADAGGQETRQGSVDRPLYRALVESTRARRGWPLVPREKGTPQGGVISPLLANLFLHYGLDRWLQANYPKVVFERFADDAIVHCRTEGKPWRCESHSRTFTETADWNSIRRKRKSSIARTMIDEGHTPTKSLISLAIRFGPRRSKNRKGKHFINFSPAVSNKSAQAMRDTIRSWNLPKRSDKGDRRSLHMFNPIIRGWLRYYGRYYRSALYPPMRQLDRDLALWAKRKYKRLRNHLRRATHWIASISRRSPALFAHWQMGVRRGSVMGAV